MYIRSAVLSLIVLTQVSGLWADKVGSNESQFPELQSSQLNPFDEESTPAVITKLDAGWGHALALTSNGKAFGWGINWIGQLGISGGLDRLYPEPILTEFSGRIIDIEANQYFTGAIIDAGEVFAMGNNENGQLAQSTATSYCDYPARVMHLDGTTFTAAMKQDALSCGWNYMAAIGQDNKIYTWGLNVWGALGDGSVSHYDLNDIRPYPMPVKSSDGSDFVAEVKKIESGQGHTLALLEDGTIRGWGYNYGSLGAGYTSPQSPPYPVTTLKTDGTTLTDVIDVQVADASSFALCSDGTLYAFGDNDLGQLGDGTTDTHWWAQPVKISTTQTLTNVVKIIADRTSAMAILSDGTVYVWGNNSYGQLGLGFSGGYITYPTFLSIPFGFTPRLGAIKGTWGGALISGDSDRVGWGVNSFGVVGNNSTTDEPVPVEVTPAFPAF